METHLDCYWRDAGSCDTPLNKFNKVVFIIASNDPSRFDIISEIKKIVELFNLEPKLAVELEINNNHNAFCDNICAYIRGACINIVDLTAPLKECGECDSLDEEPSVNVYWEYGYAAGLKRPIILICEEDQAESIPFNILDKQILYYNKDNIIEELGRQLQHKISQPAAEEPKEANSRRTESLNAGKTTDALKTMGKGEMVSIIQQTNFQDLVELTKNVMETILQIETLDEQEEFDGMYSFINILLKSNFTDEEFIKIFKLILTKFLDISDFRVDRIRQKISESIRKAPVKNWIREKHMIDDLIEVFANSDSFYSAGVNSRMIYPFAEELSEDQVIKFLENIFVNEQIRSSYKAKPIIAAMIRIQREKIPIELWENLIHKELDDQGQSIIRKFKESGFVITFAALHLILSLNDPWKKVEIIIKKANSIPNLKKIINLNLLKEISDENIHEKLSKVIYSGFDKKISEIEN